MRGLGCLPEENNDHGIFFRRRFELEINFWESGILDKEVLAIAVLRIQMTLPLHPNLGLTHDAKMPRETG